MKKISQEEMQRQKRSLLDTQKLTRHPIVVVLENVRSAYNVGAIFRTADSVLAHEVILVGLTPCPPSTHMDKSALGATDCVPWRYFEKTSEALDDLRASGYAIVALEQTDSSRSLFSDKIFDEGDFPLALIVGNEVSGVDQATLDSVDYSVDIPMYGRASSLNVATATGVVVYDALRRYKALKLPKT